MSVLKFKKREENKDINNRRLFNQVFLEKN